MAFRMLRRKPKIPVEAPELIDDRAISTAEEDELRHAGVAEELAYLVQTISAPANVALFGSWGAGKSGLARLLRSTLNETAKTKCVIYDAFKYADFPLRRDFISQVATALKIDDPEFHDELYSDTTSTNIKVPLGKLGRLLGLFVFAALSGMTLYLGLAVLVAALLPGAFDTNFKPVLQSGAVLLVTPAALLAAFVALANKWIPIEHKRSKPSSEEEFEKAFRRLINRSGADKLVVVIDELDRCAPRDVVATLESIRTFLDIPGSITVVAADQAVIEQALSESLEQATPIHRSNPYYSSGSEYIDKVFQYQVAVPPLMPRRLSGYALRLVQDRGGIWREIDHDRIVSALIPVHVRSPRRVKTLLNAFVTTYRMAQRRHDEGVLHAAPRERADEIAKLVCLRHEFPIFADELNADPQMPRYVLDIARMVRDEQDWQDERPAQVSEETWSRAAGYARGTLDVDILLPDADADTPEATALRQTRSRHSHQLLAYLQGTDRIAGPARDLIHLETGGEAFGLSPAFADDLENEAVSGAASAVDRIVSLESREQQRNALRLLARRAREAEISGERRNALTAMTLAAVAIADSADDSADPGERVVPE
jgi:hypothetical protein